MPKKLKGTIITQPKWKKIANDPAIQARVIAMLGRDIKFWKTWVRDNPSLTMVNPTEAIDDKAQRFIFVDRPEKLAGLRLYDFAPLADFHDRPDSVTFYEHALARVRKSV